MVPDYTTDETTALESLEEKLTVIRDSVRAVVKQFSTGLVLHGKGGTSKSYTVLQELASLKANQCYHNTRLTARGLVDALERSPSCIHIVEDAETLLDDKKSFGVLRSALWSQSKKKPPEREITWTAFKTTIRFVFTGGIIIISNVNLAQTVPEIAALKTRIKVIGLDFLNEEIRALMKKICLAGYQYGEDYLTPDECWEVCEFITLKLTELKRDLDLRLLMNGFKDYLQWKTHNSENYWHTLLEGRMAERVISSYKGRAELKGEESRIALAIQGKKGMSAEAKVKEWQAATGGSQAAFYRALKRTKGK